VWVVGLPAFLPNPGVEIEGLLFFPVIWVLGTPERRLLFAYKGDLFFLWSISNLGWFQCLHLKHLVSSSGDGPCQPLILESQNENAVRTLRL